MLSYSYCAFSAGDSGGLCVLAIVHMLHKNQSTGPLLLRYKFYYRYYNTYVDSLAINYTYIVLMACLDTHIPNCIVDTELTTWRSLTIDIITISHSEWGLSMALQNI